MQKEIDLFDKENEHLVPEKIKEIFSNCEYDSEDTYNQLKELKKQCEAKGYTFDWYLDANPFNLRKLQEYETT